MGKGRGLRPDPQLKLLELTRQGRVSTLAELAREIHTDPGSLARIIEDLNGEGRVSLSGGIVGLDARQRIALAEQLIHLGRDPQRVSRFLEWQEFENFAMHSLEENGFHTAKHLVFRTRQGKREIDVLAWNDTFLFAVDCKHWLRGLSPSRLGAAADAQLERSAALAERPELLSRLGVKRPVRRRIMPILFALGDPLQRVMNGVPVVSVSKLISFLFQLSPVDESFRSIPVKNLGIATLTDGEPKP